jgi:hypothetical protein
MPEYVKRRRLRFTERDLARAIKIAERHGKQVMVQPDGTMVFVDKVQADAIKTDDDIEL